MRVVADTNVVVSGLLWRGPSRRLLEFARAGAVQLVTTSALLEELADVLARAKFTARLERSGLAFPQLVSAYAELAEGVTAAEIEPTIVDDPDDDAVLAAAIGGRAGVIVTGDSDLLHLARFRHVPIISVVEMVTILASVSTPDAI